MQPIKTLRHTDLAFSIGSNCILFWTEVLAKFYLTTPVLRHYHHNVQENTLTRQCIFISTISYYRCFHIHFVLNTFAYSNYHPSTWIHSGLQHLFDLSILYPLKCIKYNRCCSLNGHIHVYLVSRYVHLNTLYWFLLMSLLLKNHTLVWVVHTHNLKIKTCLGSSLEKINWDDNFIIYNILKSNAKGYCSRTTISPFYFISNITGIAGTGQC